MEHRDPREATLQREEIDIARRARTEKGRKKRALKRALLGPRWFREKHRKCFRKNGGDDETRTRDLCRDSGPLIGFTTGSKITARVLNWSAVDSVVRSDNRGFGVAGSFSQCAFALILW